MSQHLLHAAQIGGMVEQMASKGMAQHVRRQPVWVKPGQDCELLQQLTNALSSQMPDAAARREEPTGGQRIREEALAALEMSPEGEPAWFAQRPNAFPAALARSHPNTRVTPRHGEG